MVGVLDNSNPKGVSVAVMVGEGSGVMLGKAVFVMEGAGVGFNCVGDSLIMVGDALGSTAGIVA